MAVVKQRPDLATGFMTGKLRVSKNDFIPFVRSIDDQLTDSEVSELFSYYIRMQVNALMTRKASEAQIVKPQAMDG